MAKEMRPVDVRAKSEEQLAAQLLDLRKEQFNLRFQRAAGQTEGVGRVKTVRRDIARIKTILAEKKRSAATTTAN
jgi:large subunit ribosomal protein L29